MQASSTTSLPAELIAQHPLERRDESRLLVYSRATGEVRHRVFRDLPDELAGRDARRRERHARRAGADPDRASRAARCCCSSALGGDEWEGLARPTRRLRAGRRYGPVELLEHLGEGRWRLRLTGEPGRRGAAAAVHHRAARRPRALPDGLRAPAGSAAAPTAGPALHAGAARAARRRARDAPRRPRHVPAAHRRPGRGASDPRRALRGRGPRPGSGSGRRPRCSRSARRRCACSRRSPRGGPLAGRTELFITPGFEFRRVDCLLTNFHLPRSTLLALVMAFAGVEETRRLYRARGRGALPLLLVRRRDADPLSVPRHCRTNGRIVGV